MVRGARRIDPATLPRLRTAAQLLHRPASAGGPVEVVRAVAGIQAQDPNAARHGVRARSRSATAADVDRARAEERSLVRTWAMRGTLHLVASEDLEWVLPLFAERQREWSRSRLAEGLGVPLAAQRQAVRSIERLLDQEGMVTRQQVLDRIRADGVAFDRNTAGHHLPRLAVLEGVACMGPERGAESTYVLAREWLGELRPVERKRASAELAHRYLSAFGPAGERDMAAWSGLPLQECRAGLQAIAPQLSEVRVGEETLLALRGRRRHAPARVVRLLPGFDNYLLGHRDREFAVRARDLGTIWPGGGIIRPAVIVDGRAAGTWAARRTGGRVRVSVDLFEGGEVELEAAIEREVEDIGRFEGREAALAG